MKKKLAALLVSSLVMTIFVACGANSGDVSSQAAAESTEIVEEGEEMECEEDLSNE